MFIVYLEMYVRQDYGERANTLGRSDSSLQTSPEVSWITNVNLYIGKLPYMTGIMLVT